MADWEYRVITLNTEYETAQDATVRYAMGWTKTPRSSKEILETCLAIQASMGWELVATLPAMPSASSIQDVSVPNPWIHHLIFKRPLRPRE